MAKTRSGLSKTAYAPATAQGAATPPPQAIPISQQPPTAQNTPVVAGALTAISQMDDAQLAALARRARGIDMPNMLADAPDRTQEFVYAAGMNEKPAVLSDSEFQQFMRDNGIDQSEVLSRSIDPNDYHNAYGTHVKMTPKDIIDMLKYSRFNYIGGKYGGKLHGAGTYFDQNGGANTGYGRGATAVAVLNPKTARAIDDYALRQRVGAFRASHPQFARAVGGLTNETKSIYALAMGYNVITDGSYHNVIDRAALVYRDSNA